jgi:hypothetical protein
MGWNTTVLVLNDALHIIENDPQFGARLVEAIQMAHGGKQVDVAAHSTTGGIHCNAATVIETHHADRMVTVKIGQNMGEVVKS